MVNVVLLERLRTARVWGRCIGCNTSINWHLDDYLERDRPWYEADLRIRAHELMFCTRCLEFAVQEEMSDAG